MRRFLLPALMISLLLCGCGGGAEGRLREQRARFSAAEELSFTLDATLLTDSEVFDCTLSCVDRGGDVSAEVTAPETVAGIRVRIGDGGGVLEYGDVSLGVGAAARSGISPVSAVPLLTEALRGGFLRRCWTERDGAQGLLAAEIYVTDEAVLTVWFDAETLFPVHAEFAQDGRTVLRCEIRDFAMQETE